MLELPANTFTVLVTTLAAWQLTSLLFYDRGPFRMLVKIRELAGRTPVRRLTLCFFCMAVWVSAFVVLAVFPLSRLTPVLVLAVGGAVSLIEKRLGSGGKPTPPGMPAGQAAPRSAASAGGDGAVAAPTSSENGSRAQPAVAGR